MSVGNCVLLAASALASTLGTRVPFVEGEDPAAVAREAFRLVCTEEGINFLLRGDDERLKAGIGALLIRWRGPEHEQLRSRIEAEMRSLGALSAMQSGLPVDFASVLAELEEAGGALGLLGIYLEVAGGG